jgi:hypothetical protein
MSQTEDGGFQGIKLIGFASVEAAQAAGDRTLQVINETAREMEISTHYAPAKINVNGRAKKLAY